MAISPAAATRAAAQWPMKLRGIASSKRRLEAHRRNLERRAPPAEHVPEVCADGAIRCSCAGGTQRYSPMAYSRHLAGHALADGYRGTFTTGREDPWTREQELKGADVAPDQREDGEPLIEYRGEQWRRGMNQYQQATLTNPRTGETVLDTRLYVEHAGPQLREVGGYVDEF